MLQPKWLRVESVILAYDSRRGTSHCVGKARKQAWYQEKHNTIHRYTGNREEEQEVGSCCKTWHHLPWVVLFQQVPLSPQSSAIIYRPSIQTQEIGGTVLRQTTTYTHFIKYSVILWKNYSKFHALPIL